uniref:immunity 49 family protein n=1 Tax=Herbidospora sakaeratensis TaxID=564415 RepID=UPI0007C799D9|nr:immunity 49 family protein [Herbidospora sakaeratensis]
MERHRVSETAVETARRDFAARIGAQVRSLSKAGPMGTREWWLLAEEFLDYLGALSLETPGLGTPETRAVLADAAAAAVGAVEHAAYHPHDRFQVTLAYVGFGMDYEPGSAGAPEPVTTEQWLDAFSLAILSGRAEQHGEAFDLARRPLRQGADLIDGLLAGVYGLTEAEAHHPPSDQHRPSTPAASGDTASEDKGTTPGSDTPKSDMAGTETPLSRTAKADTPEGHRPGADTPRTYAAGTDTAKSDTAETGSIGHDVSSLWASGRGGPDRPGGDGFLDQPLSIALHALRALADRDQEAFSADLIRLLRHWAALPGPGAPPRSLLPLLPLALAALAHRREGWRPPIETAYLPRSLVTGFASAGPRVLAHGRGRRPETIEWPVVFERPDHPQRLHPESEALLEKYTREAITPEAGEPLDARDLIRVLNYQEMLFQARASLSADVSDRQLENLRLASQLGAAIFRTVLAAPGEEVGVTIGGRTLTASAHPGDDLGPGHWQTAVNFALITGAREDLAPIVQAGSAVLTKPGTYSRALHDYLRGADPQPVEAASQGFLSPPAVLFSQLVGGDEESFNLALLDALEAHRDHYSVADRADDASAAINLDILALACHASRRGHRIRVVTPYLPPRLLQGPPEIDCSRDD